MFPSISLTVTKALKMNAMKKVVKEESVNVATVSPAGPVLSLRLILQFKSNLLPFKSNLLPFKSNQLRLKNPCH